MGTSLAGTALPALSGLFGGLGTGQLNAEAQKEQYILNKRNLADAEAQQADVLSRQTQTNPLRDQAIYQLSGMLGASPAAFNPTSFLTPTNTGPQGVGGVNLNALAQHAAQYRPGAGGVTSNVQQMILNRLGYGNTGTGTMFDTGSPNTSPPPTPPDRLSGTPGAAQTTGATLPGGGTPPGQMPPGTQAANAAGYASPAAQHFGLRPPAGTTATLPGAAAPGLTYAQQLRQLTGLGGL